jgi:O-antigen/teichoic acid export membrane protein
MSDDLSRKILRNTSFIFLGRLWFLGVSLLLTPYLLSRLGPTAYGIWVLTDSLARTVALLDLGFATSFVKHVAEHHARGDRTGVSAVLTTGVAFYLAIGLVILTIAVVGSDAVLSFIAIPAGFEDIARTVLRVALIASIFGNLIGVYQSLMHGLQKMDVSAAIMVLMSLSYVLGTVLVLEAGLGLIGLAGAQLVTQIIGLGISHVAAGRLYVGLAFTPLEVGKHWASMFRYGLNVHASNVASHVNVHLDKLLLSRFLDASHVAFYDVGSRPSIIARSFSVVLLSAITPAASEVQVSQGRERLYDLFLGASRYAGMVAIPLFAWLMIASPLLMTAWVGDGYESSVVVLQVLSVGFLIYCLAGPVTPLVQGMGKPEYQRNAELVSVVLNIVLSVALIKRYGFVGAPVGTAIAISAGSIYYVWRFHRLMGYSLFTFLKTTYWKPFLCAVVSSVAAATVSTALVSHLPEGRGYAFVAAVLVGVILGSAYLFLLFLTGHLRMGEVSALMSHLAFRRVPNGPDMDNNL